MKRLFSKTAMMTALAVLLCTVMFIPSGSIDSEEETVPCFGLCEEADTKEAKKLYPGGMTFGVKFFTDGVTVIGFCDVETKNGRVNPAYGEGMKIGDVITEINGIGLAGASDLTSAVEKSNGETIDVTYKRDGERFSARLTPALCADDNSYKIGVWVRDSGAGIGTVTFIDPSTGAFGGLGHGICDSGSGEVIPIRRGIVSGVTVSGIVKGTAGAPGEIKGYFNSGKCGTMINNTDNGVFGVFTSYPVRPISEPVYVGSRDEISEGKAYVMCTLNSDICESYEIEISDIRRESKINKCFTVKITDERLLERTGGIIQGMSGSPIIQNGKLVGAVTHVMINDPTKGYGIFIDNMLQSMPETLK